MYQAEYATDVIRLDDFISIFTLWNKPINGTQTSCMREKGMKDLFVSMHSHTDDYHF